MEKLLTEKIAELEQRIAALEGQVQAQPIEIVLLIDCEEITRQLEDDESFKEKLMWMKEVGIKEFREPPKYYRTDEVFTEKYIKETPLKILKERFLKNNPDFLE